MSCPSFEALSARSAHPTPGPYAAHLEGCEACQRRWAQLRALQQAAEQLPPPPPPPPAEVAQARSALLAALRARGAPAVALNQDPRPAAPPARSSSVSGAVPGTAAPPARSPSVSGGVSGAEGPHSGEVAPPSRGGQGGWNRALLRRLDGLLRPLEGLRPRWGLALAGLVAAVALVGVWRPGPAPAPGPQVASGSWSRRLSRRPWRGLNAGGVRAPVAQAGRRPGPALPPSVAGGRGRGTGLDPRGRGADVAPPRSRGGRSLAPRAAGEAPSRPRGGRSLALRAADEASSRSQDGRSLALRAADEDPQDGRSLAIRAADEAPSRPRGGRSLAPRLRSASDRAGLPPVFAARRRGEGLGWRALQHRLRRRPRGAG